MGASELGRRAAFRGIDRWRAGLELWRGARLPLCLLALAAQYAALLPEIVQVLVPRAAAGMGSLLLWTLVGFWLQALAYARLIERIHAVAGGEPVARRRMERPALAVSLAVAGVVYQAGVAVGVCLLVVPGFYISVTLLLFAFPIVLEGRGPLMALGESRQLVGGRFWLTCRAISVASFVYVAYAVFTWVPQILAIDWTALAVILAGGLPTDPLILSAHLFDAHATLVHSWTFALNPLLGALVMPPVLATLYGIYRQLAGVQPARAAETDSPLSAAS